MENKHIFYYESIDSTNVEAERMAMRGAPHGTVIVAKEQTAGKGRRGRAWESPAGENIYMSILLRPHLVPERAPMLTLVMAYSIAKAIQNQGFDGIQIKWPNDLILRGKKICGILTEMKMNGSQIGHVIIGAGINVNTKHFPEDLKDKASSLFLESGKKQEMEKLLQDILNEFGADYDTFLKEENLSFMVDNYNSILVNCGKEVVILEPGNEFTATALGVNEKGELIVRLPNGKEQTIYAGEVSVRGVYGYI